MLSLGTEILPISTDAAERVNGLNLTVPEDAKEVIKSWDQRGSTDKYIDSGVDDQVCCVHASSLRVGMLTYTQYLVPPQRIDHSERTVHTKCANTIHIT